MDPRKLKRIILFGGWGKSGQAVLRLAAELAIDVYVLDDKPPPAELRFPYKGLVTGDIPEFVIENKIEAAVVSPGFALRRPEITQFKSTTLPVVGEANFGNFLLDGILKIAVTGTDGKSSVVHFANEILQAVGIESRAAGNYGHPLCDVAADVLTGTSPEALVIELSSYQLENITGFNFDIACWTNFAPDHENRYDTLGDYFGAKANLLGCTAGPKIIGNFPALIAKGQTGVGSWQSYLNRFHHEERGNDAFIGFVEKLYRYEWGRIVFLGEALQGYDYQHQDFCFPDLVYGDTQYLCPSESKIVYRNLQTVLCIFTELKAMLAENKNYPHVHASLSKLPTILKQTLPQVSQLPHRQEFVADVNGVKYYNDSKATTVQAVAAALQSFDAPIHLLLGGRSKGADFKPLLEYRDNVRYYTYGEAADEIAEQLKTVHPPSFKNVREVVLAATKNAKPGDIILLSPACTSWDEFKSFEQRGDFFRQVVESL